MPTLIIVASLLILNVSPSHTGNISAGVPAEAARQNNEAKPSAEQPKIDPVKEADIRKLMELSGSKALATQTMDGMEKSIKPLMANSLPPGEYRDTLIDLFFAKFHARRNTQQLLDLAVPIYDKYFSDQEIKGLIEFYGTPLGQKALGVLPKLMGELQAAGRVWGDGIGRQCMIEVLAENPELAKGLSAAQTNARPQ
jgi:hypothetical protein